MSRRAWHRPFGLAIVAAIAASLLWRLGSALPLPHGVDRTAVDEWLRVQGAPTAVFALARVTALVMAAYVFAIGVLGTIAGLSRAELLSRLTVRVTLPSLRPLLAPIAAVTITVASALPVAAQGRGEPRPPAPVMQVVEPTGSTRPLPVMTLVVPETPTAAPAIATHTVEPGESFWSIAEDTVRAAGHDPSDGDVVRYWRSLIETNREQLRVRDEPDLIYPGQVFVLPPVS